MIGWDGSVTDGAAILFAQELYRRLRDRAPLAVAVGDARRAVLASPNPRLREDWHLARVWLGPDGGGPVVSGTRKRTLLSAGHATKTFLDKKKQHVPVAEPSMFVVRRRELRQTLQALRAGERAGVLLHGQGRLGKSSLAARIADRFTDRAVAVVFGDYSALGVLDAIAVAVQTNPAARELIEQGLSAVRQRPEALESLLVDLLSGPCAQTADGQRPLLLIVDDLEQILEPDPAGLHRVAAGVAPVLAAVLRAFSPDVTDSRLVVTSRFRFTLDGLQDRLEAVQLEPLSAVAQRKLARRQQARTTDQLREERQQLAERAVAVSRGNPGLQDLIGGRLVYSQAVDAARAETAVAGMEAYLDRGWLPSDTEVREFLENLALDTLIDQAGPAHTALLRQLTVFDLPVPDSVAAVPAARTGGSIERLCGLGLADVFPDGYRPDRPAVAVNALTAGRLTPLTASERAEAAAAVVEPLHTAWGGLAPQGDRDPLLALQLTRLALLADQPTVAASCAVEAVRTMRAGPAVDAFRLGSEVVALLDRHGTPVPGVLLRVVADAAASSGDGDAADALLQRAVQSTAGVDEPGVDPLDHARALGERARRLVTRGDLQQAEQLLRRAHQLFTTADSELEAAAVDGEIADILYQRGDYDEALRIHRQVQLPVYERLGDNRETAVTWGNVADILFHRGDYDEALRIHREETLPVYERLGDTRSTAVAWGKIADILYQRGDYDESLRIRREMQLPVFERLGDTRETAITWGRIADILYQRGDYDESLRIHREQTLPVYERLGDTHSTAITWSKIADILYQRGDYDESLRIHREETLPVYERLGDTRSTAVTWGKVADILFQRDDYDEALRIRQEVQLPVFERLGDIRSTAVAWGKIADILYERGDYDEALRIRHEVQLPVYKRLGETRETAITWGRIADILYQRGDYDEALRIHQEEALPVYERLGDIGGIASVNWGAGTNRTGTAGLPISA
nr:hypothetical protein GCM10020092_041620 [Actinoplanes digitatis]